MDAGFFPITFTGMAAFSRRGVRVLLWWLLLALLCASVLLWLAHYRWLPVVERALESLPSGIALVEGRLQPLTEDFSQNHYNRYLHIGLRSTTPERAGDMTSDVRLLASTGGFRLETLVGSLDRSWPKGIPLDLSPDEFLPWWMASKLRNTALALAALFPALLLFWTLLATLLSLPPWIIGWLLPRSASLGRLWALAASALLPALGVFLGALALYTMGWIGLLPTLALLALHPGVAGIYMLGSCFHLAPDPSASTRSPFADATSREDPPTSARKPGKDDNPFA